MAIPHGKVGALSVATVDLVEQRGEGLRIVSAHIARLVAAGAVDAGVFRSQDGEAITGRGVREIWQAIQKTPQLSPSLEN